MTEIDGNVNAVMSTDSQRAFISSYVIRTMLFSAAGSAEPKTDMKQSESAKKVTMYLLKMLKKRNTTKISAGIRSSAAAHGME